MLDITQAAMDQFNAQVSARVVDWHQRRLMARFPALADVPAAVRDELVTRNRDRARDFGFEREEDVGTYLDCCVMYGEGFVEAPWAARIVQQRALHGPDRMVLIRHALAEAGIEL